MQESLSLNLVQGRAHRPSQSRGFVQQGARQPCDSHLTLLCVLLPVVPGVEGDGDGGLLEW